MKGDTARCMVYYLHNTTVCYIVINYDIIGLGGSFDTFTHVLQAISLALGHMYNQGWF